MKDYKTKLSDSCDKLYISEIITQEQKEKCNSINSKFNKEHLKKKRQIFGNPLRDDKLNEYNKFIKYVDDIINKITIEKPGSCDADYIKKIKTLDELLLELIKYVNDINYNKYYRNESNHNDEIKRKYVNMDIRRKKLDDLNGKYDTLEKIENNNILKLNNSNNYIYLIILSVFIIIIVCLIIYIIKFLK